MQMDKDVFFLIAYILELAKINFFFLIFYQLPKRNGYLKYIAMILLPFGMTVYITHISEEAVLIYICFVLLCSISLYHYPKLSLLVYSLCAASVLGVIDSLSTVLISAIFLIMNEKPEPGLVKMASGLVSIIFLVLLYRIMLWKNHGVSRRVRIQYWVLFLGLGILNEIILAYYEESVMKQIIREHNLLLAGSYFFIIVGVFGQLILIILLAGSRELYREKDELNQRYLKMQEQHYQYLAEKEKNTKKLFHDMRNHMYTIQLLLNENDFDRIKKYIDTIWGKLAPFNRQYSVNNPIVDAIMNQCVGQAEKGGVSVEISGHLPDICHIEAFDLCAIFSNLMSNALEAAFKSEEKKIYLLIRSDDQHIYILERNSCPSENTGSHDVSSKPRSEGYHGYGLLNIKESVSHYGGSFETNKEEDNFVTYLYLKNCKWEEST